MYVTEVGTLLNYLQGVKSSDRTKLYINVKTALVPVMANNQPSGQTLESITKSKTQNERYTDYRITAKF